LKSADAEERRTEGGAG